MIWNIDNSIIIPGFLNIIWDFFLLPSPLLYGIISYPTFGTLAYHWFFAKISAMVKKTLESCFSVGFTQKILL